MALAPEIAGFYPLISALDPWHDRVVIVGGWAHRVRVDKGRRLSAIRRRYRAAARELEHNPLARHLQARKGDHLRRGASPCAHDVL